MIYKASPSFLKKRSKKLLLTGPVASAPPTPMPQRRGSFFASFFSKKEVLAVPFSKVRAS
jgi:hypothetical protein